jgi:hypothetical protein
MKTPMQEMIEWLDKMSRNASSIGMGTGDLELAMMHAKSMLEKEKDVIENAYWDGGQEVPTVVSRCEEYYNKTFNTTDQ